MRSFLSINRNKCTISLLGEELEHLVFLAKKHWQDKTGTEGLDILEGDASIFKYTSKHKKETEIDALTSDGQRITLIDPSNKVKTEELLDEILKIVNYLKGENLHMNKSLIVHIYQKISL